MEVNKIQQITQDIEAYKEAINVATNAMDTAERELSDALDESAED